MGERLRPQRRPARHLRRPCEGRADQRAGGLDRVGIAVATDQERYKFFSGFDRRSAIFAVDRVQEGTLTLLRSPLDVILAHQNGAENCISFLTEAIYPEQLEALAILMQERGCKHLELF